MKTKQSRVGAKHDPGEVFFGLGRFQSQRLEQVLYLLPPLFQMRFAIQCAERMLPFLEKRFPGDPQFRNALALAKRVARGEVGLEDELDRAQTYLPLLSASRDGEEANAAEGALRDAMRYGRTLRDGRPAQGASALALMIYRPTSWDYQHEIDLQEADLQGLLREAYHEAERQAKERGYPKINSGSFVEDTVGILARERVRQDIEEVLRSPQVMNGPEALEERLQVAYGQLHELTDWGGALEIVEGRRGAENLCEVVLYYIRKPIGNLLGELGQWPLPSHVSGRKQLMTKKAKKTRAVVGSVSDPALALDVNDGSPLDVAAKIWRGISLLPPKEQRLFGAWCAEQVLPLFESVFPRNPQPRRAIEAAKAYAQGQIDLSALDTAREAARDLFLRRGPRGDSYNAVWSAIWSAAANTATGAERAADFAFDTQEDRQKQLARLRDMIREAYRAAEASSHEDMVSTLSGGSWGHQASAVLRREKARVWLKSFLSGDVLPGKQSAINRQKAEVALSQLAELTDAPEVERAFGVRPKTLWGAVVAMQDFSPELIINAWNRIKLPAHVKGRSRKSRVGAKDDPSVVLGSPPYSIYTVRVCSDLLPLDLRYLFGLDCVSHVGDILTERGAQQRYIDQFNKVIARLRKAVYAGHMIPGKVPRMKEIGDVVHELAHENSEACEHVGEALYQCSTGDAAGAAQLAREARGDQFREGGGFDDQELQEGEYDFDIFDTDAVNHETDWQIEQLRGYLRDAFQRAETEAASQQYATLTGAWKDVALATLVRQRVADLVRATLAAETSPDAQERCEAALSHLLYEEGQATDFTKRSHGSQNLPDKEPWTLAVWAAGHGDDGKQFKKAIQGVVDVGGRKKGRP